MGPLTQQRIVLHAATVYATGWKKTRKRPRPRFLPARIPCWANASNFQATTGGALPTS